MIKEIKISNFYSFGNETIVLQPDVNILVGINGSGKSNFFKAVRLIKEGVAGKGLWEHIFQDHGTIENILFKGENVSSIQLEYIFSKDALNESQGELGKIKHGNLVIIKKGIKFSNDIVYKIIINKSSTSQNYYIEEKISTNKGFVYLKFDNGVGKIRETFLTNDSVSKEKKVSHNIDFSNFNPKELALRQISDPSRYAVLDIIKRAISKIDIYTHFDTSPNSPIRNAVADTIERKLNEGGNNLPQILQSLKHNYQSAFKKITDELSEVNQNFLNIDFKIYGDKMALMLGEKSQNSFINASGISDGTLRYLCLLAILYNPEKGKLICIDEPELGLHPDMLRALSKAIKVASEQSTIIFATHSVGLLNYFQIENLQIFEKNETNATEVATFNQEQFEGWYDNFSVGKMWISGDFGGVRYGG
jgi:predicted ATPase